MRWFPNDETQAHKVSIRIYVLCAVYADDFFVVFKNLVWCKFSFIRNNFWNFSFIVFLEINLSWPISNFTSSDLLDLGSNFDFLEAVCILRLSQKNWRVAPIWHNNLDANNIVASFLPFESKSLDRFVFWHSFQICNIWVSEIDCNVCISKEWEFSKSFETFLT